METDESATKTAGGEPKPSPATKAAGKQEKDDEEESSGGGGAEPEVSATPAVVVFSSSHMFIGEEKETREGYFGEYPYNAVHVTTFMILNWLA
uniref:Uncharacterized protein n=1 Tax=Oryza barthii TaxID=65489 RepID=A0A679BAY9_9ORYZ|nr:hypothetical protein [Oryza barthii]